MVNKKIFMQQVFHLLESDTYLRVSDVSSKLMISKPTTRRLLNWCCSQGVLKKELRKYVGNAYEYLYSRF